MIRRMIPYTLQRHTATKDSYGEKVKAWSDIGSIECAISLNTGTQSTANNILTTSSTHIAITDSREPQAGDKLIDDNERAYVVDYAVKDGRKTLLYLKDSTSVV